MTRDPLKFPDDATGDALFRIYSGGDPLTTARNIDFTVVFPAEPAAHAFVDLCRKHFRLAVEAEETNCDTSRPWDVRVVVNMIPNYAAVTAFEEELERLSAPLDGENAGWGCWVEDGSWPTR